LHVNKYRFLPADLSTLLTEYLAIVRPLEIWFCELFQLKGGNDLKEFMWADYKKGVWDGDDLSNLLKQFTAKNNMRPLGIQEYRQVITAFMEKHLRYKSLDDGIPSGDNIFNLQAGHGDRVTNKNYAVALGDSQEITRDKWHYFNLASEDLQGLLKKNKSAEGIGNL
jgi:hypothetical protein